MGFVGFGLRASGFHGLEGLQGLLYEPLETGTPWRRAFSRNPAFFLEF